MNKALDYYRQKTNGETEPIQPRVFTHVLPDLVPQQTDSFNCGIYTILFTDFLAKKALREMRNARQDTSHDNEEGSTQGLALPAPTEQLRGFDGRVDTAWLQELRSSVCRSACDRFRGDVVVEIKELVQAKVSKAA